VTVSAATDVAVDGLDVTVRTIETDEPESDGTLEWDSTTIVVVEAHAGGRTGIGYTYGDASVEPFIRSKLADVVRGRDALDVRAAHAAMDVEIRNAGRKGVGAMALSAVDCALWDLAARLLDLPLCRLLGRVWDGVPIYGSGGFTSYSLARLQEQLGGWAAEGIPRVKMKVGRDPDADPDRARAVREAIGDDVELMVDANGAYTRKQALYWAERFAGDFGVQWLEEPVSSEDLAGMRLVRDRGPGGLAIAAGEYGWTIADLHAMADCVDVLQADVTRCGGITNLLRADALCVARGIGFSAHCAPSLHAHAACACGALQHLEYFHDHVRVEAEVFDGTLDPAGGVLRPDLSRPGNGLELKR
jgi:L-alanine-DL-glutamate epimerase-like enolase superfamily enzyme